MGIRNLKSTTPGSRFASRNDFAEITKHSPEKKLTSALRKTGGRNNRGRITSRHIGGGHKRRYRIIDFKRDKFDVPAKVSAIEYDPNRSANIALLFYADGEKRYIIAPSEIKIGDEIVSGENAPLRVGNTLPLGKIATGMFVHNIELIPGTCITSPQIFPVTDNFVFTVGSETTFPALNVIGVPGVNDYAGSTAFGFWCAR